MLRNTQLLIFDLDIENPLGGDAFAEFRSSLCPERGKIDKVSTVYRVAELPSLFDSRATHAHTLLPAALAFVPSGFVLVRVRVVVFFK
jgi:hypothetical protein